MKLGIVGLPNVGKTTLFNAVMQAGAEAANYPFSTVTPNVGVVPVPDPRLYKLDELYHAKAVTPATLEMVDIAGLVKGSGKGEGLGNQFLAHIREVDAIVHVVRCFDDENVPHVYEGIDPLRDIETINLELIFSDMEIVERRLAKAQKSAQSDKNAKLEAEMLSRMHEELSNGGNARAVKWDSPENAKLAAGWNLLTQKPVLYALNVSEDDMVGASKSQAVANVEGFAKSEGSQVFISCAKFESEIATLEDDEKAMFLEEMGVADYGLNRLILSGYELLGLISFFTVGPKDVRAWTIPRGINARMAAGKIHSDLERGFIRAEVIAWDELIKLGSFNIAKERGQVRIEGKDYIVKDGEVMHVRFNV